MPVTRSQARSPVCHVSPTIADPKERNVVAIALNGDQSKENIEFAWKIGSLDQSGTLSRTAKLKSIDAG
jgi:hypothetical protein